MLFDSVFVGISKKDFVYDKLNLAFHCIKYNNGTLYGINESRYFKENINDNEFINNIAAGFFVSGLEYSTNKKAIIIGKPSKTFFESGKNNVNCEWNEICMIGDDAIDDVNGAIKLGMKGILVKTGKYINGDENKLISNDSFVCDNFDKAIQLIIQHNSQQRKAV